MNIRKQEGFTGVDISISIIILFIFVSIIATLSYQFNNTSKQIERRGEAIEIAIQEIEKVKNQGFENYENLYSYSEQDNQGNNLIDQPVDGKTGYYRTIQVQDYTELRTDEDKIDNIVKKVTVKISYKMKNKEEKVELSTILSKEN